MHRRNQSFIFSAYFFSSLGYAFIGIFYPVLLKNAFGLSLPQSLLLVAFYWLLYALMLYPLHWWIMKYLTISWRLAIGQFLLSGFYFLLQNPQTTVWYMMIVGCFFASSITFYWGNLEFTMQKNTHHDKRGSFWGAIQSITIGVNILTPVISSYFLESQHASWVFILGIMTYALSALAYLALQDSHKPTIVPIHPTRDFQKAILSEFFQHGITGTAYPLLVVATLGSLKALGALLSIMGSIELVASFFLGHLTDKISAKRMLRYGSIARMIDMAMRSGLVLVPTFWMAGIIAFFAPLFGPLYQPAYMSHLSRSIETSEDAFSFWIYRGFLSGIARIIFLPFTALLVWQFGIFGFIPAFFIAGASVWWVRNLR